MFGKKTTGTWSFRYYKEDKIPTNLKAMFNGSIHFNEPDFVLFYKNSTEWQQRGGVKCVCGGGETRDQLVLGS